MHPLRRLRRSPALALFFLSPVLAELVTGSMPPLEFFPIGGLFIALLYGCGALLVREAVVRWNKGWFSLLLLGMAYGIYEEGIVVRSFFDPNWVDLDMLGTYGRAHGVNWVWAVHLTQFHALVSIVISVLIAELLYPSRRNEPWLSRKQIRLCAVVLLSWTVIGFGVDDYVPPLGWYLLAWAAIGALIWAARRIPAQVFPPRARVVPRPRRFWALGFVGMTTYFLGVYGIADADTVPPLALIALLLAWDGVVLYLALRWSGNGYAWDDRHKLALAAGAMWLFVLSGLSLEAEGVVGMSLMSVALALGLEKLARTLKRRAEDAIPLPTEIAPPRPA